MSKYVFVVLTNPVEGKDAEFNDWYTNRHIDDVLKLPGFVAAQRFRFVPKEKGGPSPLHKYLALYDVDTDDIEATHARLVATAGSAAMPWSDAIERSEGMVIGWYFEPVTERKVAN